MRRNRTTEVNDHRIALAPIHAILLSCPVKTESRSLINSYSAGVGIASSAQGQSLRGIISC